MCGICEDVSMFVDVDYYGLLLIIMEYYGLLWIIMDYYGLLWIIMDYYGIYTRDLHKGLKSKRHHK